MLDRVLAVNYCFGPADRDKKIFCLLKNRSVNGFFMIVFLFFCSLELLQPKLTVCSNYALLASQMEISEIVDRDLIISTFAVLINLVKNTFHSRVLLLYFNFFFVR